MKKKDMLLASTVVTSMALGTIAPLQAQKVYQPGVTVEQNTNSKYDADYQATFVYEDDDVRDAINVSVVGSLQFYDKNDSVVSNYATSAIASGAKVYNVYDYKDGMFNTGYGLNDDSQSYNLVETSDERFEITLPLPSNEYYYDYTITYSDGSSKTIQDPVNPSPKNSVSGHDSGHSLFYVGDKTNTTSGQEEIYARTDGKTGTYSYVQYTATDGSQQPLGVYLPYGYSSDKTYPTLYVSHGGGGNEAEWMAIGSLPNIMDNLMAEGEMSQAVVVTMDNNYFNWNYDKIAQNFEENIFPYVEQNYSVSKDVSNRALCGLSMGALTTGTLMFTHTDMFQYYGCFSGTADPLLCQDLDLLKTRTIYLTGGNVDMAIQATADSPESGFNRGKTVRAHEYLTSQGVEHGYDLKDGAHDWGVWRSAITTFAKDYLWDSQDLSDSQAGVSVSANTNDNYDADYQAKFVYNDTDEKDAVSVTVAGNLQFYDKNDSVVKDFSKTGDATGAKVYSVYDYKDGMFNTGYGLNSDTQSYSLTETKEETFEITLPLPGNQYYYDYTITYSDGSTKTIQDPANPSLKNELTGKDAGHSYFYVGSKDNTTAGQEYIYPRSDDNKGSFNYVSYTATDGSSQSLGVYLPKGYDSSKNYKTLYVSHGGGGNEAEWNTIGSLSNIMDNLIANGEVKDTVVVTMNNNVADLFSDGGRTWYYDVIAKNFKENIIPFMEKTYNVSTSVDDRALCGLSMGSMTTSTIMLSYSDLFGYYGCFSGANTNANINDLSDLKTKTIYLTAGSVDMALMGDNVGTENDNKTLGLDARLTKLGVTHSIDTKDGAHDWGVWRSALTTFVKDYLWNKDKDEQVPTINPTKPITSVKTGDDVELLGLLSLMAVASVTSVVVKRKKFEV